MKLYIIFLIFIFSSNAYTQKLGTQNLFYLLRTKDTEKRIDFLSTKRFEQQNSNKDLKLKFVFKRFNKRTQEVDEEIVIATQDTINYILKDPKKYITLKKAIEYECANPSKKIGDVTIYKNKHFLITLKEEEIPISKDAVKKNYIFSITNVN